jgi:putative salt-induced outer membrane protein
VPFLVLALACALACVLTGAPGRARADGGGEVIDLGEGRISQWMNAGAQQESQWSGEAELGYLSVSGNAPSLAAHARTRIVNDRPRWRHQFRGEAIFSDTQDTAPSQQYRASQMSAYKVTPENYLFAALRYDRNVAQGIRWRWSEVGGYGRRVFNAGGASLLLEAGAGARQTRRTDVPTPQREPIGVLIAELDWAISEGSSFNEYAIAESGRFNTLTFSQTALTLRIQGNVSARLSYEVTHNTDVPAGVKHTDATSSVTLVYKF